MSAARAGGSDEGSASWDDDEVGGWVAAATLEGTTWQVTMLTDEALTSLDSAESQLRAMRSEGAYFGLLNVDDEFFVLVRPAPSGTRLLISDATAALDYDLAADVLEELNVDVPDLDPESDADVEPWEEGDLGILSDLGVPESVLSIIVSDSDEYPEDQLMSIAENLGFDAALAKALPKS